MAKDEYIPLPNWIKWDKDKGKYIIVEKKGKRD